MSKGIIILEGADCSGKTTLATVIRSLGEHEYVHCGISDEVWKLHSGVVGRAGPLSADKLVIIDRLWLSEQVYGQAYRSGPAYDFGARFLDRLLTAAGAITVLCVPENTGRQKAIHQQRRSKGDEAFADAGPSIQLYWDLCHGDHSKPGGTYLDELIRTYNPLRFTDRETVYVYDFMRVDVNEVAAHLFDLAAAKHVDCDRALMEAMA